MTQVELRDQLRTRIRDKTVIVGTTPIIAGIVPTGKPIVSSYIRVVITGATVWGQVKLIGYNSEDNAQDETLTFIDNAEQLSIKRFARLSKVECSGFTGGTIEIRIYAKDFEDTELDEAINQILQLYAQQKPKFVVIAETINKDYKRPADKLWIKSITDGFGKQVIWENFGEGIKLLGFEPISIDEILEAITLGDATSFSIEYAIMPAITDIQGREHLILLGAEAFCDKMKAEEPDRFVGIAVAIPDIEKLTISNLFLESYKLKIGQFKELI